MPEDRHGEKRLGAAIMVAICAYASSALAAPSCGPGGAPAADASPVDAATFARLLDAWRQDSERIAFSSNTHDYVALPSFQRIVGLGPAALPYLERKLTQDQGGDFMLAEAVAQICGWDRHGFTSSSEQTFRDAVLERLRRSG
jgi:hypothetical protein